MEYFVNPEDLRGWVKHQKSSSEAAEKIMDMMGNKQEKDIVETCDAIYNESDENASAVLFGVLAKHFATVKTSKTDLEKTAQSQSRQRNDWVKGERNKFNRVVDGFNEGTPWRVDRDKMYNFTHYYTDAISFDEDPKKVYSGEAIWRMYVMDKFTREYQNKDGKWVGGYVNDRFYVFPTAGTPANPDAPRDGGNQMGLAPGEKTRMPRPHQYSVERRMEEARGNKTFDLEALASNGVSFVKLASNLDKNNEKENDKIYNIFKDTLDMREAGIKYDLILNGISEHYGVSILNVAQIDKIAQSLKNKHAGISYEFGRTAQAFQAPELQKDVPYLIVNENGIKATDGRILPKGADITYSGKPNVFYFNGEEVTVIAKLGQDIVDGGSEHWDNDDANIGNLDQIQNNQKAPQKDINDGLSNEPAGQDGINIENGINIEDENI